MLQDWEESDELWGVAQLLIYLFESFDDLQEQADDQWKYHHAKKHDEGADQALNTAHGPHVSEADRGQRREGVVHDFDDNVWVWHAAVQVIKAMRFYEVFRSIWIKEALADLAKEEPEETNEIVNIENQKYQLASPERIIDFQLQFNARLVPNGVISQIAIMVNLPIGVPIEQLPDILHEIVHVHQFESINDSDHFQSVQPLQLVIFIEIN